MNSYGMNQKRSLFVIGGIIALLGFLIVVLIVTKTPEEVLSTSSEIPETVDLTNHKIGELESLTVENGEGSYTIRPTEPGVESYYVEELQDLPCNHDAVKYAVQGIMDPVISQEVGEVDDLEAVSYTHLLPRYTARIHRLTVPVIACTSAAGRNAGWSVLMYKV